MTKGVIFEKKNGSQLRIAIAVSKWNDKITFSLLKKCQEALLESGVKEKNITVIKVPGAFELPYTADHLIRTVKPNAVICLGCLIKGQTMHFEYIAEAVTQGIMRLNLERKVPVIFGVLTCLTEKQALARAGNDENNHGYGWGKTAVEMGLLRK
ncbi:MAG: 6,7-dimethyl-8-ribityllumazine synthase [bacterium]|nr:6,7-dimethyl-8-ribityllumazine synthase [bacterium]